MEFRDFLLAIGLLPRDLNPGKWTRCATTNHPKKKNGSFLLAADGQIGWGIDYAVHAEHNVWRPESVNEARIDHTEIARRRRQEQLASLRATEEAVAYYRACHRLTGSHPYLDAKGLSVAGCGDLRIDAHGALIIPMLVGGKLTSIQRINAAGEKRFWPGAPSGGAQYTLGTHAMLTVLTEGFATGLTLYHAIPNCRVVVAFNAGNLGRVADTIPKTGLGVVAADNDHTTQLKVGFNPGLEKAQEVADRLRIGMAYPTCKGSDWDDYRQERIAEILEVEAMKRRPKPLKDIESTVSAEIAIAVKRMARRMMA